MAQRFTGLAGRVEPVPGSALVRKLAAAPTEALSRRTVVGNGPVATGRGACRRRPSAGLLGGLWRGSLAALAIAVPLVLLAVALLGASRLRGAGRPGRWGWGPRAAALGGAAAGVTVAYAVEPPLWLSAVGLLAGLGVAVETARRLWRAAIDSWAAFHATTGLRKALAGLDALAEAVREHWAVEERLHCADAARSVAGGSAGDGRRRGRRGGAPSPSGPPSPARPVPSRSTRTTR